MPTLSLDPQRWDFRFGQNMPPHPDYGAFSFIFPGEGGEVDYLTQTVSMAASKRVVVVSQIVAMSGVPVFHAHQDPGGAVSDAYATIMLQRNGDNMVNEDGRWWAQASHPTQARRLREDGSIAHRPRRMVERAGPYRDGAAEPVRGVLRQHRGDRPDVRRPELRPWRTHVWRRGADDGPAISARVGHR